MNKLAKWFLVAFLIVGTVQAQVPDCPEGEVCFSCYEFIRTAEAFYQVANLYDTDHAGYAAKIQSYVTDSYQAHEQEFYISFSELIWSKRYEDKEIIIQSASKICVKYSEK